MSALNPRVPKSLIVVGAGGLGTEYVWVAESMNAAAAQSVQDLPWNLLGYADEAVRKGGTKVGRYTVFGNVSEAGREFTGHETYFVVAIGDNRARARLAAEALAVGWRPATLIHPSAILANDIRIGAGSYIAPGCVVCPNAKVGQHVIINTHVSVGHDAVLEDFVQVCPGARISGGCRLGVHAFMGSNASLGPGVSVGASAVVGANSHAVWKVAPGKTVMGNPALPVGGLRIAGEAHEG